MRSVKAIIGHFRETLNMDREKRAKEEANRRFVREELGHLLKLFSSLGIVATLAIVGFFLLGRHVDGFLKAEGVNTRGVPAVLFALAGVAVAVFWSYARIARHLEKFNKPGSDGEETPERE